MKFIFFSVFKRHEISRKRLGSCIQNTKERNALKRLSQYNRIYNNNKIKRSSPRVLYADMVERMMNELVRKKSNTTRNF